MKPLTVYHKDYCPYCRAARRLLDSMGWTYKLIDVEHDTEAFTEMVARSGQRTVPQIFNGAEHIGGSEELVAYVKDLGTLSLTA